MPDIVKSIPKESRQLTFVAPSRWNTRFRALCSLLLAILLISCAGKKPTPIETDTSPDGSTRTDVTISDPAGPIPEPKLPPELRAEAASSRAASEAPKNQLHYTVTCTVKHASGRETDISTSEGDSSASSSREQSLPQEQEQEREQADGIISAFEKVSRLHQLIDTPTESVTGLEQRLSVSLDEARDVLKSLGYYSGQARGWIRKGKRTDQGEQNGNSVEVRVLFLPGERYLMGTTTIIADVPEETPEGSSPLPRTLEDVGLASGSPAVATEVLEAVERVGRSFLDNGYPFARISNTRYIVDHEKKVLEAEVRVIPGSFVRMGEIERTGAESVNDNYVQNMRRWRVGRPWRQSRVESYQEALRQSGLFQSIVVEPGQEEDEKGNRKVVTKLESASERTVGGALKYHSDFGPGVQGFWEHRNLTGNGDRLRIDAPLWLDMQEISLTYRLPFFLRQDQDFIANGGFLNQDTDAYSLTSAAGSAGIERRFNRQWSGSIRGSAEGGTIKEPNKMRRDYYMLGVPLGAIYNTTNDLLNATKGQRLMVSAIPYFGEYEGNFSILRTRVEGQAFFPVIDEDKLVMALRGVVGMISGEESMKVPPSARFYSGGGGSVRGYEYQSLGPRNSERDPLGGASLLEASAEARWKFTPEWGFVAFVDGGSAFENSLGQSSTILDEDMRWGAGVGLRYYTAIGPVRLDVATPLNPRSDDDAVQFYISIGQSF